MKELVVAIIINYHTSHLMPKLLSTLKEDNLDLRIIILDNGSTEETYQGLSVISDERVEIVRSLQNLGFTGGINHALRFAIDKFGKFSSFFIFNPDAFSSPGLIYNLKGILESRKDGACVSPRIMHVDGSTWYSGAKIDFASGTVNNNPERNTQLLDRTVEVDVFSGCAALFDLEKVLQVGMFNADLFMYYDEVEMSLKLKSKGWKILYAPNEQVLHDVSYTTRGISHMRAYYMTRNKFAVLGKTMPGINKLFYVIHELAFYIKNRKFRNAVYHIKGLIDHKKGRYGPLYKT